MVYVWFIYRCIKTYPITKKLGLIVKLGLHRKIMDCHVTHDVVDVTLQRRSQGASCHKYWGQIGIQCEVS